MTEHGKKCAMALIVACATLDRPVMGSLAALIDGGGDGDASLRTLRGNPALNCIEGFFDEDQVVFDTALEAYNLLDLIRAEPRIIEAECEEVI